jgi:hypothetical protein
MNMAQPFDIWVRRVATATLIALAGCLVTWGIVLYI